MMTVHEVSQLAGVSICALHHYDRIGLLHPTEVTYLSVWTNPPHTSAAWLQAEPEFPPPTQWLLPNRPPGRNRRR